MRAAAITVAAAVTLTAGCAFQPQDGPPPGGRVASAPVPTVPGPEPLSRYGNPSFYEELGERYHVMRTASGYRERGVASWYGRKFHGRRTSSGEPYDMHAMTAAHKTLPLPTWVRVTNLQNQRSIIVRVNDRGPFVDKRLIDLSYAAALELDLVRDGTGLVEVEAITFDQQPTQTTAAAQPAPVADSEPKTVTIAASEPLTLFIQAGAFSNADNAHRRAMILSESGIDDVSVEPGAAGDRQVFRVRIGPIADVPAYDRVLAALQTAGIRDAHLITGSGSAD
jgi:rare lipoprotein A